MAVTRVLQLGLGLHEAVVDNGHSYLLRKFLGVQPTALIFGKKLVLGHVEVIVHALLLRCMTSLKLKLLLSLLNAVEVGLHLFLLKLRVPI